MLSEEKSASPETEDHQLLEKARQNDMQAIAMIHDRYYPKIWGFICYRISNQQVCEDIASDVFLRLIAQLKKRKGRIDHLGGWLMGTTHHLVMDHYRDLYKNSHSDLEGHSNLHSNESTHATVEDSIQFELLRDLLIELTDEQQLVLNLRFSRQFSLEETALVMKRSVGAVKLLQYRAVKSLQKLAKKRGLS